MRQYLLAFTVLVSTSGASAVCFNFVNGKGPQRVGNYQLAATATKVCVNTVSGGGSYTSVRLSDSEGDLVVSAGEVIAAGRCPGFCKQMTLSSANINGENVDLSGTLIVFEAEADSTLGITKGIMSIEAGRDFAQKYLIIGEK